MQMWIGGGRGLWLPALGGRGSQPKKDQD